MRTWQTFAILAAIFFHACWTTDSEKDEDLVFPILLAVGCATMAVLSWWFA